MKFRKNLQEIIDQIQTDKQYSNNIVDWHTIPEREASVVPFPNSIDSRLNHALQNRGIQELYTHQGDAFETIRKGENFVAVTPTASGKTLCYNLPVLQQIIDDPNSRALYIFPTKALAQDQKSELNELIQELGININSYTYDGDTPANISQ